MDLDLLLSVLSRWVHVGTAIVLVGGTCCLRYVVHPVLAEQPDLRQRIRDRWKKFVHIGIALFLISGFYNYFKAMPLHKGDGLYHGLVGTKIILAFIVFFLASTLVGRSAGTQKFRDNAAGTMALVLALSAVIVAASGFLKVREANRKKVAEPATAAAGDTGSSSTSGQPSP